MIGGAVHGTGGPALGKHLADAKALNENARPGSSRGLLAEGIEEQTRELTELAAASGHKAPLRHVFASPPAGSAWSEETWAAYWRTYERAMGLQGCPYSEAIHDKPGDHGRPEHRHRVYLALTDRGTLVRLGWDYARQEAVSRITEFDTGAALTRGKHNVRAARYAEQLGRPEVAAAMREAGLLDGSRAEAKVSPRERLQAERTGTDPRGVGAAALAAWRASDDARSFLAALEERGLRLARGDRVVVLIDQDGGAHPLARLLGRESKADGGDRIAAREVADRLGGLVLPDVSAVRQVVREQGARMAPATPEPRSEIHIAAPVDGAAEPPRGKGRVAPVGDGGGGWSAEGPDSDYVAPLDPTRPGDFARWAAQVAALVARRAARAAREVEAARRRAGTGAATGGPHVHSINNGFIAAWLGRASSDPAWWGARTTRVGRAPLDHGAAGGSARRHGFGGSATGIAVGGAGQEGAEADGLRAPAGGDRRRGDAPGGGGAVAADRPGGDAARPGDSAPGGGRGEPGAHRAKVGRHRVQARRAGRGLAARVAERGERLDELRSQLARGYSAADYERERLVAALRHMKTSARSTLRDALPGSPEAEQARQVLEDLAEVGRALQERDSMMLQAARRGLSDALNLVQERRREMAAPIDDGPAFRLG